MATDRSHHYFHSGYIDLILSGLVGIRPREDDALKVDPLVPGGKAMRWFRTQDVPYHGRLVTVTWDADGRRLGTRGLTIEVDGRGVARRSTAERVVVPITRVTLAAIARPIDLAGTCRQRRTRRSPTASRTRGGARWRPARYG